MTKYIHIEKGMEEWLTPDMPNNYIDIDKVLIRFEQAKESILNNTDEKKR